jgi:enolase-phosphatase E1
VTPQALEKPITALLLDIEGTTTPIDFVYNVLFPYARRRVKDYLAAHWSLPPVSTDVAGLVEENINDRTRGLDPPALEETPDSVSVAVYVLWLMDQDRKTTPLKSLQGKIWDEGYRTGELRSQVFADVAPALRRWNEQGKRITIYSSGSVLAQKLLFGNTEAGDLTPLIDKYFDTNIGAKKDPESYRRIVEALELDPSAVLFLSDVSDELDAAATAGLRTLLCVRPGNNPQQSAPAHAIIRTFDEVLA